jgi:hypothetical protein
VIVGFYLLYPRYVIRKRTDELLVIETSSGRSVFLIALVGLLLVNPGSDSLVFGASVLIMMTYSQTWTLSKSVGTVSCRYRLLFLSLSEQLIPISEISEMRVSSFAAGEGWFKNFRVQLITRQGKQYFVATYPRMKELEEIALEFDRYLPKTARHVEDVGPILH